jgi:hypothetical protein
MKGTTRTRIRRVAFGLGGAWLLAGCAEAPAQPKPNHASTVYGRVTTPAGAPVQGARIFVVGDVNGRCPAAGGEYLDLPADQALTDASGSYRASARVFLDVSSGCVHLDVMPPPGSALGSASVSGGPVRYGWPPVDSVRVDVQLPAG